MEIRRTNEDEFEPPSGTQLSILSETINRRIQEAEIYRRNVLNLYQERWSFVIDESERFSHHNGLELQAPLSVGLFSDLETEDTKSLFLAFINGTEEHGDEVFDYFRVKILKANNSICDVQMASISKADYVAQTHESDGDSQRVWILEELERGKCDTYEVERLIQIMQNVHPLLDNTDLS